MRCRGVSKSLSLDIYDQWETMEKGHGKWRFTSPTHVVRAFKQTPFYYTRNERAAGRTKYSIRKMFSLASAGIFGFSKKPLKLAISLGTLSIFIALAFAIWVFIMYLSGKESIVPGWSSTIITIVFLGGVQLFTIGILGEYIGNIFDETKNRPEYIIDKKINFDPHNNQTI